MVYRFLNLGCFKFFGNETMASSIIEDTILCKFFTHRLVKWSCQFEIDELMFTYDIRVLCLFLNQVITNIHPLQRDIVHIR